MSDSADRTIPATPRRREAACRQGLAPRPHQVAWLAAAVTTLLLLPAWARATLPAAAAMMRKAVAGALAGGPLDAETILPAALVLPTLAVIAAASAAGVAGRFLLDRGWGLGRAAVDPRRISPAAGLRRIFAGATALAVCGHAAGLVAIILVAGAAWWRGPGAVAATGGVDPAQAASAARSMLWPPLAAAAAVTFVGHILAWRRFEAGLRMTPEEYVEESRSMQADPKIRLLHRQALRRRG